MSGADQYAFLERTPRKPLFKRTTDERHLVIPAFMKAGAGKGNGQNDEISLHMAVYIYGEYIREKLHGPRVAPVFELPDEGTDAGISVREECDCVVAFLRCEQCGNDFGRERTHNLRLFPRREQKIEKRIKEALHTPMVLQEARAGDHAC